MRTWSEADTGRKPLYGVLGLAFCGSHAPGGLQRGTAVARKVHLCEPSAGRGALVKGRPGALAFCET